MLQVGCEVRTECQVQYVVKNPYDTCQEEGKNSKKRRWRVYLNEIDYITSDFVVLSAGVLGTTEILFQSQMRGLKLSDALGSGFSCNGNNVACLAGSPAPLNSIGLDRKQLSKIPFQERPGPSISSSYTSSLGFTIQSAVLPTAYPHLLFKGIVSYGWPTGHWLFHGIIEKIRHILGFKACQAIVLNAMGYDDSDGKIMWDKDKNRICFSPPHDPLLPQKVKAFQKLTKKLGGILFLSRYRSASVHLLGGCNASSDPSYGVCNPSGQVFDPESSVMVHQGLYVCDGSLIPCSVGINPSLTIASAAEYVSRHLVKDVLKYKSIEIASQNPHSVSNKNVKSDQRSVVTFEETMRGYVGGMQCTVFLKMKMNAQEQKGLSDCHPLLRGKVGGYVELKAIERDKLHIIDGKVSLCEVDYRTPYTQYMHYHLLLAGSSGLRYIIQGRKIMTPYLFALYAWRESTTLHVTFKKVAENNSKEDMMLLKGRLSVSMVELLKSLISLRGNNRGRFICHLLYTLYRTYFVQKPQGSHKDFPPKDLYYKFYPSSTLHEIKTEDGFTISCRQWKCTHNSSKLEGPKKLYPVLLLNGYSSDSYWLPTEPNDLVRTLLEEGHEIWLLQPRLHPLNPSNKFTIEDIGRFDVPAAINRILELHGQHIKIHVVAHCVGGLVIHIALMGGHVSATNIASLSCTNTSMFFKLNTLSMFKMWLPLLPVSSLSYSWKNKILPMLETSKSSLRHRLLKSMALMIPRYERCTCNECELFSGLFGNAFWHENLSPSMHYWLNKENVTMLPMAAFPHLRKICNAGNIVDSKGNNSYLIHPERMSLPTLYISGGRTILATPKTSFLANKYMKLHQPGFRHERVVVEGFGHSDLLIGEESYKKVFPHILSHIRSAERENGAISAGGRKYSKEAMDWEDDPYEEYGGFSTWFSPFVVILLFSMLVALCLSIFNF
ncbi:hypothetical protein SO802_030812 [Lithocarpus litseifolius]|uniref:Cholesterol oxidase n=1 Tax=Lithocarpus litseifolius TaxID=425828 RepID=A0AAW2BIH1_9ROSI